jgi:thiol:disulfide interchange protein DsbA
MNRREFSAGAACVLGLAALGLPVAGLAQAKLPKEGTDYVALDRRAPVDSPAGKVEVVDFFWYSCPHCNAFEPTLQAWVKKLPEYVAFRRVPVAFRDDFVPQQRLFYTLEALGKVDELHSKVFHAIHDEHIPLNREDVILDWAAKQGLDREKFREIFNSFTVVAKQRRAVELQEAYKVQGVPALGIAGRFYTDGDLAGSMPRALQITDYLIAESRKKA